jgi:hypothetical protein
MTGALPDPFLLVAVTLGLVAAFALNEARHRAVRWWRARKTPVPGGAPPIAPPTPGREGPIRPALAPGHHYGQLNCVTKDWDCGCRHYFDGTMRLITVDTQFCTSGQPDRPDAIDLWYRGVCAKAEEEQ